MIEGKNVRARVYAAEKAFREMLDNSYEFPTVLMHGSTIALPVERKFATLESIQTYVDKVLALNWLRDKYPTASIPLSVRERKGQKAAHYAPWSNTIAIPPHEHGKAWAMRELVVLHELTHHLDKYGNDHDATFTGAFVDIVSEIMSAEASFILRTLFYDEKVFVG